MKTSQKHVAFSRAKSKITVLSVSHRLGSFCTFSDFQKYETPCDWLGMQVVRRESAPVGTERWECSKSQVSVDIAAQTLVDEPPVAPAVGPERWKCSKSQVIVDIAAQALVDEPPVAPAAGLNGGIGQERRPSALGAHKRGFLDSCFWYLFLKKYIATPYVRVEPYRENVSSIGGGSILLSVILPGTNSWIG